MHISLNSFHSAANQLEATDTLRFKESGEGIACTGWERFQVTFFDIFRSGKTIAAKKAEVLQLYTEAVKLERGQDLWKLAKTNLLGSALTQSLKSGAVIDTATLLTQHGGQNWLKNEQLIQRLVTGTVDTTIDPGPCPSLSGLIEEIVWQLNDSDLLTADDIKRLQQKFNPEKAGATKERLPTSAIIDAVTTALRQASRSIDANTIQIKALDPAGVRSLSEEVIRPLITESFNCAAHRNFNDRCSLEAEIAQQIIDSPLEDYSELCTTPAILEQIVGLEKEAISQCKTPLTRESMQRLRDTTIAGFLDRQQEKLEGINALALPDSAVKEEIIKTCLGTSLSMGIQYFAQLERVAREIEALMTLPTAQAPKVLISSLLKLGQSIEQFLIDGQSNDLDSFVKTSTLLFASRTDVGKFEETIKWTTNTYAEKLVRAPITKLATGIGTSSESAAGATSAECLFEHLQALDRFRNEFAEARRALPTLSGIAVSERTGLVRQANEKGLSRETIDTIQSMYADAFREDLSDRRYQIGIPPVSAMLEALAIDEPRKSGMSEHEQVLNRGQQIVRRDITQKIIQAINASTYAAFAEEHPLDNDRLPAKQAQREPGVRPAEISAVAAIRADELRTVRESQELLTPDTLKTLRQQSFRSA